ncbi:MAG: hypothetical protein AAFS10_18095 [Myxococcota bacterium]
MNVKLLIDAIVRQTTVLIAQLSTTAGIRAPLAHVADQVFVELVREIESQGIGRKVVADMFGLALRTYQKKVQRLTESVTTRDRTLWEAVLDYIQANGGAARSKILHRFRHDGEQNVAAVLNDLVISGLVYKTGRGTSTIYGMTSEDDLQLLLDEEEVESLAPLVWVTIYRQICVSRDELHALLRGVEASSLERALDQLKSEGRITTEDDPDGIEVFRASNFLVPVGSESGWEAAVFDHYQAVVTAVCAKLQRIGGRSATDDVIGGATLSFYVQPGPPFEAEVYGQLRTIRTQVNALWERVAEHNRNHPAPAEHKTKVTFYFGQTITDSTDDDPEGAP